MNLNNSDSGGPLTASDFDDEEIPRWAQYVLFAAYVGAAAGVIASIAFPWGFAS